MPTINEYGEPDHARTSKFIERVQRSSDRSTREENVIYEDDRTTVDSHIREGSGLQGACRSQPQVIAIHGDIKSTNGDVDPFELGNPGADPAREWHSARLDAKEDEILRAFGALNDLVGDPSQNSVNVFGLEDRANSR